MAKLVVFDSHPVQYRVPVWKKLTESGIDVEVVYAFDPLAKSYVDREFGQVIAWDDPMLEGYKFKILSNDHGEPFVSWGSITGEGVKTVLKQLKPDAVLLTGLNYKYDLTAYINAKRNGIPVWLRCETQDEATPQRSFLKQLVRKVMYGTLYAGISRFFYIGELNKQHYLKHGVPASKLIPARYGTVDRFEGWTDTDKQEIRNAARLAAGIGADDIVIGFSGKLVPKKNPDILFKMLDNISPEIRSRLFIYFMGSGELELLLRSLADTALKQYGVRTHFTGFVNQSQIGAHYLAMDILVLPSRRMGETWGLVVNEAMQAGCSVIVSDAVGSSADFKNLERFRVFKVEDDKALAEHVENLSLSQRDFNWAQDVLKDYAIEATAEALALQLKKV